MGNCCPTNENEHFESQENLIKYINDCLYYFSKEKTDINSKLEENLPSVSLKFRVYVIPFYIL
jgi:hypothetical protein